MTADANELLAPRGDRRGTGCGPQVERVPAGDRTREGVVGDWSVQDMVWHCARWADYCGEHLEI